VTTAGLLAPMIAGGTGMGMVFVPLFDIIMGHIRPHEMGSASGVLQAVNALGMSIGVAGIGAVFFGLLGPVARPGQAFVSPAEWTLLVVLALLAAAFMLTFRLPAKAREAGREPSDETPATMPDAQPGVVTAGS